MSDDGLVYTDTAVYQHFDRERARPILEVVDGKFYYDNSGGEYSSEGIPVEVVLAWLERAAKGAR